MMQDNLLLEGKVSKVFLTFCIPAILSMLIAGMQTIIDGMFVGNVLGTHAMASINIAAPFMQLILGMSMIVSIGTQSFIGLRMGEGHIEKAQNAFKTFLYLILLVGGFITLMGVGFNDKIATFLGASDLLKPLVCTYIKTISIFAIPMAIMFLCGFSNRLIGRPDLYFKGMLVSLLCNLGLNYLFIAKLGLGIAGAAMATGLSYSSALLMVILPLLDKEKLINIHLGKWDLTTVLPVLYNGSSEGIISLSVAISAYIFNMAFMSIAGENGVAAFTAINYVGQFGICILFGISDGIGPIVSCSHRSERYDRVKQILKLAHVVGIAIGTLIFIVLFLFGENLIKLFMSVDQQIVDLAAQGAKIYAIAFFMNGFNIITSGYFTFIGEALNSVIIAASRGLLFIILGIILLPQILGINGVWATIPFAEFLTIILGITLIKMNNRRCLYIKIRKKDKDESRIGSKPVL